MLLLTGGIFLRWINSLKQIYKVDVQLKKIYSYSLNEIVKSAG